MTRKRIREVPSTSDTACPKCSSPDVTTTNSEERFEYGVGNEAIELTAVVPLRVCRSCGFNFLDFHAEEAQHNAICDHLGILKPEEILAIRQKYGLSRSDFAQITKIGEATLGRWERGANLQNFANDHYLRLLSLPENFARVRNGYVDTAATASVHTPKFRLISNTAELREKQAAFTLLHGGMRRHTA